MELRHLRYFEAVASEGTFLKAARRLNLSQPALSKQIRDLEREVGVPLLERTPRGIRLTLPGRVFRSEGRRTLDDAARAVLSARRAHAGVAKHLLISHDELLFYAPVVAELFHAFRTAHPDVVLDIRPAASADQPVALRRGLIDLGVLYTFSWPLRGFAAERLVDCALTGVLLPAGYSLAATSRVRLRDLGRLKFVWGLSDVLGRPTLRAALKKRGLVLRARRGQTSLISARLAIAAGGAWTLTSQAAAALYASVTRAVVYRPFHEAPIPLWIALAWREPVSGAAQTFLDVAREMQPSASQPWNEPDVKPS